MPNTLPLDRDSMAALRAPSYERSETPREEAMNVVRDALYAFGDMQMLANRTGISRSCLEAIRSGRTKWPRPGTLFTILTPLGLSLHIVRAAETRH